MAIKCICNYWSEAEHIQRARAGGMTGFMDCPDCGAVLQLGPARCPHGLLAEYDALERMVEENNSGSYTQFAWSPTGARLGFMSGQTFEKAYVPLSGGVYATYKTGGLNLYRHNDWLGSYRLATYPNRTVYFDGAYGPFGETYAPSGAWLVQPDFTGQSGDTTGTTADLYDFPYREYGIQGRWPSPDPAGIAAVNPASPQSWNRYAYALNNPLLLVDPLGFDVSTTGGCQMVGGMLVCTASACAFSCPGYTGGGGGGMGHPAPLIGPGSLGPHGGGGVHKNFSGTFNCNTDAAGVINQLGSNFSQFANLVTNFGPAGIPAATGIVTFGNGPVTQGATIDISQTTLVMNPFNFSIYANTLNVSVTVASVSSTSFTFAANPGHVLYPASISFSAVDSGDGQVSFSVQVNGDFANAADEALYYAGGSNLENQIWNNLKNNVQKLCNGTN